MASEVCVMCEAEDCGAGRILRSEESWPLCQGHWSVTLPSAMRGELGQAIHLMRKDRKVDRED